jgi:hypothetical protein
VEFGPFCQTCQDKPLSKLLSNRRPVLPVHLIRICGTVIIRFAPLTAQNQLANQSKLPETRFMQKRAATIDTRKDENWLERAVELFDAGNLRNLLWTPEDIPQVEEFLQHVKEQQRDSKGPKLPPDFLFNLECAPSDLK